MRPEVGTIVTRDDGSRWRVAELHETSDGYLLGVGVLLREDGDEPTADELGLPVIHDFFFGRAQTPRSWKVEVIADGSGEWVSNAIRFGDREEAEGYGQNLSVRWTLVREWRVVPSDDEPNR